MGRALHCITHPDHQLGARAEQESALQGLRRCAPTTATRRDSPRLAPRPTRGPTPLTLDLFTREKKKTREKLLRTVRSGRARRLRIGVSCVDSRDTEHSRDTEALHSPGRRQTKARFGQRWGGVGLAGWKKGGKKSVVSIATGFKSAKSGTRARPVQLATRARSNITRITRVEAPRRRTELAGGATESPTTGLVQVRARAAGPGHLRNVIGVTFFRSEPARARSSAARSAAQLQMGATARRRALLKRFQRV